MSRDEECAKNNGGVLIAKIIHNVMTSAAGAEIGALYINTRHAIHACRLPEADLEMRRLFFWVLGRLETS